MSERVVRTSDLLLMLLLGAVWGASFLFMRVAVTQFGPVPLIHVRVVVATAFLAAIVILQGNASKLWQRPVQMAIVGLTNSAIPFCLFAFATMSLTAGFASVLNSTSPLFGALISVVFLKQPLTRLKWVGLALGFLGVCVLIWSKLSFDGSLQAIAACLIAAFFYGIAAHYTKHNLAGTDPMVVATSSQMAASLLMTPLSIAYWPTTSPDLQSWLAALALGILCTGLALAIYFHLLHAMGPTRAITVAYLIPLFGVVWGALFLHEQVNLTMILGGSLIIGGLLIVTRFQNATTSTQPQASQTTADSQPLAPSDS